MDDILQKAGTKRVTMIVAEIGGLSWEDASEIVASEEFQVGFNLAYHSFDNIRAIIAAQTDTPGASSTAYDDQFKTRD